MKAWLKGGLISISILFVLIVVFGSIFLIRADNHVCKLLPTHGEVTILNCYFIPLIFLAFPALFLVSANFLSLAVAGFGLWFGIGALIGWLIGRRKK